MRKEWRQTRCGTGYYSFVYTDQISKKRIRIRKQLVIDLLGYSPTTEADAEKVIQQLAPEYQPEKERVRRLHQSSRRSQRKSQYLHLYQKHQKNAAPNSYLNNIHYLLTYVFRFFFEIKSCHKLEKWSLFYDDFKDWLETEAKTLRAPQRHISYNTKNHCIKSLNTFMKVMHYKGKINHLRNCPAFPTYMCRIKTIDDTISATELQLLEKSLLDQGHLEEAEFIRLLFFTGMRFNEALGLSIADLHHGQLSNSILSEKLNKYQIKHFGYLVLSSQPSGNRKVLRNPQGHIERKPLKAERSIRDAHTRFIPITDQRVWGFLVKRFNFQIKLHSNKHWGPNGSDYLLFEQIERNRSRNRLQAAYREANKPFRSWHCFRHTCATNILGTTGDLMLARLWLGHKSPRVIERYVHLHEELVRNARKLSQDGKQYTPISITGN